jgi:hypothetical protein
MSVQKKSLVSASKGTKKAASNSAKPGVKGTKNASLTPRSFVNMKKR